MNVITKKITKSSFGLSAGWNLVYALFNGVLALCYRSWWFLTMSLYYAVLGLLKATILKVNDNGLRKAVRFAGFGMIFMSVIISGTVYLSIAEMRNSRYHYAVMIAISVQATSLHLNNTHMGLILFNSGFFTAFGIITFFGALKTVPLELEDSAAIDGASPFRTMLQIVFPLLKPSTMTVGVLFFLWSWNDYMLPNILIGDNSLRTITVKLYMFKGTTNAEWNLLMAGVTLSMIPIIVVYLLAQKYIVSGMTAGAVK